MAAAAATQQQLQQALGAKDREVKALSEQVAQLSAACRDNKKNLAAAEAEGAAVKQHLAALQQRYAQLQAKYDWVETESAAAVEGYRTEQRKMKLQLADMAAAVSAAEAAARRVQRDEAALLQAMAHLSQQYGDDHQQLQVVRERLTAAEASVSEKQGLLYLLDQAMTEQREILLDRVYAAETRADRAQNKVLEAKLKFDDLMRRLKADFIKFNDECLAKVQQARQQAAADKAALSEQVAQLQHRLEQQDLSCDGSITLQPVSGVEPVTTVEPVSGKRSGKGLRWLLQAVR
jgi:chromosome segregation ATPase